MSEGGCEAVQMKLSDMFVNYKIYITVGGSCHGLHNTHRCAGILQNVCLGQPVFCVLSRTLASTASSLELENLTAPRFKIHLAYSAKSCANYVPIQVLDAHFVSRLLVVVEPLALRQFHTLELGIRVDTVDEPLSLDAVSTVDN